MQAVQDSFEEQIVALKLAKITTTQENMDKIIKALSRKVGYSVLCAIMTITVGVDLNYPWGFSF